MRFHGANASLVGLAFLLTQAVVLAGCEEGVGVPRVERQAQEINKTVMCPVCPGESIDQSQHPLAVQMRGIVAEKLDEGWTAERIKGYFVDSYGPSVLLEPPADGVNLLVWIVPPVGAALALALLYLVIRGMVRSRPVGRGPSAGLSLHEGERAAYFARIEAHERGDSEGDDAREQEQAT